MATLRTLTQRTRRRIALPGSRTLQILSFISQRHGVTLRQLRSSHMRTSEVTDARRAAILELSAKGLPHSTIARYLNVHHTTITYHLAQVAGEPKPRLPAPRRWQPGDPDYSGEWAI